MNDSQRLVILAETLDRHGPHQWSYGHINQTLFGIGTLAGSIRALAELPDLTPGQRLIMNSIQKSMMVPEDRLPEDDNNAITLTGMAVDGKVIDFNRREKANVVELHPAPSTPTDD